MGDTHKGHFKFEKALDGTHSVYSKSMVIHTNAGVLHSKPILQKKYLQIQTSSCKSAASVIFCAYDLYSSSKFALIFHPQQEKKHPGILVDIFSLANGCFLSVETNQPNRLVVVANSFAAPSNKFLIVAEDVE
jgi:hypothetical protein